MVLGAALEPELKFTHQSDKARPHRGLVQNAGRGGTEHRYKTRVCGTHSMDFLHCQRYTGQVAAPRDCMVFAGLGKLVGRGTKDGTTVKHAGQHVGLCCRKMRGTR